MALSADLSAPRRAKTVNGSTIQIVDSAVTYLGSFLALGHPQSDATAGDRGRVRAFSGAIGDILTGWSERASQTGDTDATLPPEGQFDMGERLLENVVVTGVTAVTDQGRDVYLNDDDTTLTLTRPTRGHLVGVVWRHRTSTSCDVLCYSAAELFILGKAGMGQAIWHLGHYVCTSLATGNQATAIQAPYHGAFLEFYGIVDEAPSGTGATVDLNLEIAATNVTGGVVTIATGDAHADRKAGTAITAASDFHEGQAIDIEAVLTGSFTSGSFNLFATVEKRAGL